MAQPVTYAAPTSAVMAQPVYQTSSYLPAVQQAAPVVAAAQPMTMGGAGQSVIVDQIGDWLVCEDAMGLFYHHTPTQQSHDNPPPEFLMLFPQGYQPPATGAFAAAGYVPGGVAAPTVMEQMAVAAPAAVAAPVMGVESLTPGMGGIPTQMQYAKVMQ